MVDGAIVPSRLSRHCFSSAAASNATGFDSSTPVRCSARPFGIVGIGVARDQIGLVVGQRAVDGDRCVIDAAVLAARQALRNVLRLEEGQDRLVVALIEIVGLGKGLGPWFAVTIADLQQPSAVALVAPVLHLLAARELRAGIGPAPDGELQSCGSGFQKIVALLACHGVSPKCPKRVSEVQ